jgi:FixJ family two-component response regulator
MSEIAPIIYIVDDDLSIRSSLSLLLESAGYKVISFNSANEFLKSGLNTAVSACLILDVKMPGMTGLELQKELNSIDYRIPIIFITGHGDIPMSVQAMKTGAINFLSKPYDDVQILDALEEALLKNSQIQSELKERRLIQQKVDRLTTRELEVLGYMITGMLNKQIAFKLAISERTVKAHRKQVFTKMEIKSIAELVRLTEKIGVRPNK